MNNPLLEKAKYYLNESNRLTEELDNQIEYSDVLEAVLEELVGTENLLAILEKSGLHPDTLKSYTQKALNSIDTQTGELADSIPPRQAFEMGNWHRANNERGKLMQPRKPGDDPQAIFAAQDQAGAERDSANANFIKGLGDAAKAKRISGNRTRGIRRATS